MSAMAKNSGPLWALEDSRTLWVLFPSGETQGKEHDVMTSATFSHAVTWIKCRIDMGGGGELLLLETLLTFFGWMELLLGITTGETQNPPHG